MPIAEYIGEVARASTTSDLFNAIADAHRREILDTLIDGEKPVGAIVYDLSMSQPQVSKHLRVRGNFLEVKPPTRIVQTWLFEDWPDAWADETDELKEADGVTTLTVTMAFRDKAGRDHMTKHDGQESSFDKLEDCVLSLLDKDGAA